LQSSDIGEVTVSPIQNLSLNFAGLKLEITEETAKTAGIEFQVLVKTPRNNRLCQKYYTYGKYRDVNEQEWYLWLTEPCRANITTWCRFRDVPLAQANTKTAQRQEKRV
uniref:DUF7808 domain-containing protein n=1 Tax=Parascaris equorum TaxID=6256 RepID=A0A914RCK7_PAREQ